MKPIKRKTAVLALSALALTMTLAACAKEENDSGAQQRVLRVGFLYSSSDSDSYNRQQYTDMYELTHPDVDIETAAAVDTDQLNIDLQQNAQGTKEGPYDKLKEMLAGSNPVDVVIVESPYLRRLVQDNLLTPLDPLIRENNFDIDDFVPAVLDGIKAAGDNQIYALTSSFSSTALFYNKSLFAREGVAPPTDNMQWKDVLSLAERLSKGEGDNRTYGLSLGSMFGSGFTDVQTYAAPLQLTLFDNQGTKMTVDTPQWKNVWTEITDLYKNKIVPPKLDKSAMVNAKRLGSAQSDPFLSGHVAMTVGGFYYVNQLAAAHDAAAANKDVQSFDWDVVTMPTFAEAPGIGGKVTMSSLMAINAKARNSKDAWDFIRFNNSEEAVKLKSRSTSELASRKSLLAPRDGLNFNLAAFYSLQSAPPENITLDELSQQNSKALDAYDLGAQFFQDILDGKKTVDAALREFQTKGDELLQEGRKNPQQP